MAKKMAARRNPSEPREVVVAVTAVFEANGDYVLDTPFGQFRLSKKNAAKKPGSGSAVKLVFDRPISDPERQIVEVAVMQIVKATVPTTEGRRGTPAPRKEDPPPGEAAAPAE